MATIPSGVLVIDKPEGMTSHDVVFAVRKKLWTKRVGHAGTLDPMATGVLVILVEEATKLEPFVASAGKTYLAEITFGRATHSLDRTGETTARELVGAALEKALELAADGKESPLIEGALETERTRQLQIPPKVSAIHVDGKRSHERERAGEEFELAPRPVQVRRLVSLPQPPVGPEETRETLRLEVEASKGYYVRSMARDLGQSVRCPAHLSLLRRVRSGAFLLGEAVPLESELLERIIPLSEAARRSLPSLVLTEEGLLRARQGKTLSEESFVAPFEKTDGPVAWLDSAGDLVAIGSLQEEGYRVVRGFVQAT